MFFLFVTPNYQNVGYNLKLFRIGKVHLHIQNSPNYQFKRQNKIRILVNAIQKIKTVLIVNVQYLAVVYLSRK